MQMTAYEMRNNEWGSDVVASGLENVAPIVSPQSLSSRFGKLEMSRRITDVWPLKKPGSSCWKLTSSWLTHEERSPLRSAMLPRRAARYELFSLNSWNAAIWPGVAEP